MKHTLLVLASLFVHMLSAQTVSRVADATTAFGRRLTDCSSGRGACSFQVSSNVASKSGDTRIVTRISGTQIKLTIFRSVLTASDEMYIAGKPFSEITPGETLLFVQEELLTLDAQTMNNLELDPSWNKIIVGNYPLTILKDRVEILFTLTN